MNELRFERKSVMSLDFGHALNCRLVNKWCEDHRCKHVMSEYSKKCGICGDTELEIIKRLRKGIDDDYEDTFDQRGKLIHRRLIQND